MKQKKCNKCLIVQNIDDFPNWKNKGNGICNKCQKERRKKYRETHLEQEKKKALEYYNSNREVLNKQCRDYKKENKEKIAEYSKIWRKKNRSKITEYNKNKRHTDANFKLSHNLRIRIARALKGKDKSNKTFELLGCSLIFLKNYLESKFKKGMSWENYNYRGWHVDHIRPCSSFDLSNPEEQRKCFHYTNLQPLWSWENFSKNDKI